MGPVIEIDDPDDPRLTDYRRLTDVALRTKIEAPHGVFIAEGALVIERALGAGYALRSALMTAQWLERTAPSLEPSAAPVYLGSEALLESVTGFHVHRGALASVNRRALPDVGAVLDTCRRVVVLEDLVNHTNLGAIFRAGAALGMDGVVLSPSCADPLYRRSVRVSMGSVFAVPYVRAPQWPEAITDLRDRGFRVLALTPAEDAVALDQIAVSADERIAVLMGTEGPGLSARAGELADQRVRIPMMGGIDSLNVASAAAIAFWATGRRDGASDR